MKKIKSYLIFLALVLLTSTVGLVSAQNIEPAENEAYQPEVIIAALADDSNDYYHTFIDFISGAGTISNPQRSLGSTLAGILNIGIMAFIILILSYRGLMFVLHTATTGVWGGQKISVFWGTLSISIALSMTVPVSGYSPAQYAIIALSKAGASLANVMASAGANWIDREGGVTPTDIRYTDPVVFSVLQNEMCMHIANRDLFNSESENPTNRDMQVERIQYCRNSTGDIEIGNEQCTGGKSYRIAWDLTTENTDFQQRINNGEYNGFCGSIGLSNPASEQDTGRWIDNFWNFDDAWRSEDSKAIINAKFNGEVLALNEITDRLSTNVLRDGLYAIPDTSTLSEAQGEREWIEQQLRVAYSNLESAYSSAAPEYARTVEELEIQLDEAQERYINLEQDLLTLYSDTPANILRSVASIRQAQSEFELSLSGNAARLVAQYQGVRTASGHESWSDEIERKGFVVLGFYYYSITKLNQRIRSLAKLDISIERPDFTAFSTDWTQEMFETGLPDGLAAISQVPVSGYTAFGNVDTFGGSGYGQLESARSASIPKTSDGSRYSSTIISPQDDFAELFAIGGDTDLMAAILLSIKEIFDGDTNLVLQLALLGEFFAGIGITILVLVGIPAGGALLKLGGLSISSGSGGALASVLGKIGASIVGQLVTLLLSLGSAMLMFGGFLTVWIPLMVPLEFAMGVMGLLIIHLTAIFVIPIWLATFAFATSHDAWEAGHFRQGFVMLLGLIIRGPLMVAVFFVLFGLLQIAGVMVQLFVDVIVGQLSNESPWGTFISVILSPFAMAALAIIAWQLISRIFALTSDLPDKIMTGLNLGQETFGTLNDAKGAQQVLLAFSRGNSQYLNTAQRKPQPPTA